MAMAAASLLAAPAPAGAVAAIAKVVAGAAPVPATLAPTGFSKLLAKFCGATAATGRNEAPATAPPPQAAAGTMRSAHSSLGTVAPPSPDNAATAAAGPPIAQASRKGAPTPADQPPSATPAPVAAPAAVSVAAAIPMGAAGKAIPATVKTAAKDAPATRPKASGIAPPAVAAPAAEPPVTIAPVVAAATAVPAAPAPATCGTLAEAATPPIARPETTAKITASPDLAPAGPASGSVPAMSQPVLAGAAQTAEIAAPATAFAIPAGSPLVPAVRSAPPAHTAGQAAAPAAQLNSVIIKFAASGDRQQSLTVQLTPAELGKVQISLSRNPDGGTAVAITAERGTTLALLAGDQPALQRSLDQAGVPAEGRSLSFNLAGQDLGAGAGGTNGHTGRSGGVPFLSDATGTDAEIAPVPIPASRTGLVNITA